MLYQLVLPQQKNIWLQCHSCHEMSDPRFNFNPYTDKDTIRKLSKSAEITHEYRLLHKLLQFPVLLPICVVVMSLVMTRNCRRYNGHTGHWHIFVLLQQSKCKIANSIFKHECCQMPLTYVVMIPITTNCTMYKVKQNSAFGNFVFKSSLIRSMCLTKKLCFE